MSAFCASVSIGAIALLYYVCNHGFTDLVRISAKNLSALYTAGDLKSLLWKEMPESGVHSAGGASVERFRSAAQNVTALAGALAEGAAGEAKVAISEFIRIHEELSLSVEKAGRAGSREEFARIDRLYHAGYDKLNEFSEAVLIQSEDQQAESILETNSIMKLTLLGTVGATLMVLLLSYLYFRKRVINSVTTISAASLEAARGDLQPIQGIESGDEIGVLAENFNHMIRELALLNHSLEEKVEDRTKQLRETESKLVNSAKMSALGEMAAGIAHEINTPLATVGVLAGQVQELVAEEPLDKAMLSEMALTMSETVKRIGAIISGLRTFSRDGSTDEFVLAPLQQVVEHTLTLCREKIKNHEIKLEVDAIPSDCKILCRPVQISQILLNLISNSCDAIASLPDKWIKVGVERNGTYARISVTDSGSGVPEEIREKIFQPFFTTKAVGKGTGLGLSISKGIMDAHRGKIGIDSSCKNTRFYVECPSTESARAADANEAA